MVSTAAAVYAYLVGDTDKKVGTVGHWCDDTLPVSFSMV